MKTKLFSRTSISACIVLIITMLLSSCSNAAKKYLPPNFDTWGDYSFTINNEKQLSIQVPAGGEEGRWTLYEASTQSNEEHIQLLAISYDLNQKSFEPYALTLFLFGLTKRPEDTCCDLNDLIDLELSQVSESVDSNISMVELEGKKYGFVTRTLDDGHFVGRYFLPFEEEHTIYFTVNIGNEIAGDKTFVEDRLAMLKKLLSL